MVYICTICGKSYDNVIDRAKCEMSCAAAQEQKLKEEKMKRLETERKMLEKKIETKVNEVGELLDSYSERYGVIPELSFTIENGKTKFTINSPESIKENKKYKDLDVVDYKNFLDMIKHFII